MPRARGFNKRIQLWQTESVSDGFGGNTVIESKIAEFWAKLDTLQNKRFTSRNDGTIDFANSVQVTMRSNPLLSLNYKVNFIVYRGARYELTENPVNKNFEDNSVSFIMVKQNNYVPTQNQMLNYQLDFYI
jgi:hypothetical protein